MCVCVRVCVSVCVCVYVYVCVYMCIYVLHNLRKFNGRVKNKRILRNRYRYYITFRMW